MPLTEPHRAPSSSLAAELAALRTMTVRELQDRYAVLSGRESRSFNRDFLHKRVAWFLQEVREGGLTPEARARAAELARGTSLRARPLRAASSPTPAPEAEVHPLDPRLPPPGAVLRKEHGGVVHEITVLAEGFQYQGTHYRSLSRIAKEVTGTSWNGFLWLGLVDRKGKSTREEP